MIESGGFLEALFDRVENPRVEIRILSTGSAQRLFFTLPVPDWTPILAENKKGRDIYFGVASRDGDGQPHLIPACWVDIDYKHDRQDGLIPPPARVVLRLVTGGCPPTVTVRTGHGYHAYWMLDTPAAPPDHGGIETINKKLAIKFNGDACYDSARILRLPGTVNTKNGENIPCEVVDHNRLRVYTTTQLASWLSKIELPKLSPKAQRMIDQGYSPWVTDRSRADYGLIRELLSCGFSETHIRATFESSPVGEKMRESGPEYLSRTIEAAARTL